MRVTASTEGVYASLRVSFGTTSEGAPVRVDHGGDGEVQPWWPGDPAGHYGTGRSEHGAAWLFGVAVDAYGVLLDRADVVVWFEMTRSAPVGQIGDAVPLRL